MIIHVVRPGETITSIADLYDIPVTRLIQDNGIMNPDHLVPGQTIVIVYPKDIYTVQEGDTLAGIAERNGVTVMDLLRNNPYLSDRTYIYPGETIVISYATNKIRKIEISGYTYPFIDKSILKKTLPFLTYLTIFNYRVTANGDLIEINDSEIINIAKDYGVAPMMFISTLSEQGRGSAETSLNIINNPEVQERFLENVLRILKTKGYYGLNIFLQYLNEDNRIAIEEIIQKYAVVLKKEGYRIIATITPRTYYEMTDVTFEKIDYSNIAKYVDAMLYLSYEWGVSYGPPASITPLNILKDILDYITSIVPAEKLFLGLPIVGYDWTLPYIPGVTKANAITTEGAIRLASEEGLSIQFDETSQSPYFFYTSPEGELHLVWFQDARSIDSIVDLVPEYGLPGISV